MNTIEWLPDAVEDLQRLHAFIAQHSDDAANRAIEKILEATESLLEFPEKGRPWENEFRELTLRFGAKGYAIRYQLFEERIIIVRIWHALEDR